MKENCLDIGAIQAFLDGELAHDETARVSGHIAQCDACAMMLADAEDESAIVFPALEREMNTLVPTQRLWNKINDSIAVEKQQAPFWKKAWVFFALNFVNPSFAAAAGLLIVIGVTAIVLIDRTPSPAGSAAIRPVVVSQPGAANGPQPVSSAPDTKGGDVVTDVSASPGIRVERAAYRADSRRAGSPAGPDAGPGKGSSTTAAYMPGEESYVKTIASLSRSIDATKDSIMRPGERIAYERDMAVVDDAIAKMRTEVKRNPRNESAKQVLYSSYQNKIDLLNSVSQKEELVASLK